MGRDAVNDSYDNEITDRAMLRRLLGQEDTVNNDDERDYEEEAYNQRILDTGDGEAGPDEDRDTPRLDALLHDTSEDPEGEGGFCTRHSEDAPCSKCTQDDGTRVIAFRVPVRTGRNVTDKMALTGIRQIMARSWKRLTPMSELAGPVTVIPEEAPGTRDSHRTAAISVLSRWEGNPVEAALTHAVLALSAPAEPDDNTCPPCAGTGMIVKMYEDSAPEPWRPGSYADGVVRDCENCGGGGLRRPDSGWRQRAVDAEAALTEIGGVMTSPRPDLVAIDRILREAGQEADRLMPPARWHTSMEAHDGYAPHSHEVRPDHKGVRRDYPA